MAASRIESLEDPEKGPVLRVESERRAGFSGGAVWYSTAELHPRLFEDRDALPSNQYCGSGWSRGRRLSREKAVTEAVERWAYYHYRVNAPRAAGFAADDTCNGFAAMPAEAGREAVFRNAYCEALERWLLNRIWDVGDVFLERFDHRARAELLAPAAGARDCSFFRGALEPAKAPGLPERLAFCLCVLKTGPGGAVAGSACSPSAAAAFARAAQEAWVHAADFRKLLAAPSADLRHRPARRLLHFGGLRTGYRAVLETIKTRARAVPRRAPRITLSAELRGPWEPRFLAHRVLLDASGRAF